MPHAPPKKQWWAPVWTGLVIDPEAKHYRQMKSAVWLYLYFVLHANRRTGQLKRKIQSIETGMGITRDTAIRWLNVLRRHGYVTTINTGRSLTIQITRWKSIVHARAIQPQVPVISDSISGKNPTALFSSRSDIPEQMDRTLSGQPPPNKTTIEINFHNEMRNHAYEDPPDRRMSAAIPWTARELLAHELARSLDDAAHINRYRAYCWRYPEWLLRKVLAEAGEPPKASSVQSRSVLFKERLEHHVKGTTKNPGD